MRPLSCLAALATVTAALAAPVGAQVRLAPTAGYDLDTDAPAIGLGVEVPLTPVRRAAALSLRPSAEYVFATSPAVDYGYGSPYISIYTPFETPQTSDVHFLRLGVDLVGRTRIPGVPVAPYAKAGLTLERTLYDGLLGPDSDTNLGATAGLGVEARRVFVEGTVGTAAVSTARLAVGVRF